ncbi:nuclear transport factor 2 family protein [Specibacter sp. RAF43]|uniref:nuclear transport factor 2 family protein n=1 Tax=Specibacter sp. RAF43 TaxID=3233057 RepID=UPI003F9582B2
MANDPNTEALVKNYFEAWHSGDMEAVYSFLADNIVYEDTSIRQIHYGIKAVKRFQSSMTEALKFRWIVDTIYATDEGFGISWIQGGFHNLDLPGMPATGKPWAVAGASIAEVRDGKIVRNRDYWNNHQLLKQLGFL